MKENLNKFLRWLLSNHTRKKKNAVEKLQMSMRATSKCRYNAAARLHSQSKFEFLTIIFLSLGLIFTPLIQNAGISLAFKPNVLNMMQIFLSVSILVYSVVIGTAKYEVRSIQLTKCGDKLKELIRELDKEQEKVLDEKTSTAHLKNIEKRYSEIVTEVENHNRNDYRFATLEMVDDYLITGISRINLYVVAHFTRLLGFRLPFTLLAIELIFITDMLGATSVLTEYLNGNIPAP